MMTKWDTIQADVADAYVYIEEEEEYESLREEVGAFIDVNDVDDHDLTKYLTLDWEE